MILKKAMSVILSAAMFSLAVIPAYAADTNGGQTTPVILASEAAAFKVTIPAVLPVHISADGTVTVSNAAQVENGSSAPIRVTNIAINEKAGWSKVATVSSKVGLKEFTFDCAVTNPVIPSKSASGIEYNSTVSPQKMAIADAAMANVVFTVAWDESGNAEIIDPNPSGYSFVPNDVKILTLNFSNIYADTDAVTWTSSNDAIATVEQYITEEKAGLQGSKQCKVTAHAVGEATITGTFKDGTTSSFNVTVAEKALTSIAVTTPPTKTAYIEGKNFDATGMVVTATYNNDTSTAITGYTLSNNTSLTVGQTSVTIAYGGKTTTTPITVAAIPTGTKYTEGDYEYSYNQTLSSSGAWTNSEAQQGWGVKCLDKTKSVYDSPLTEIQGKPVVNYSCLFQSSTATTLDLSSFDTSNVTNMDYMFKGSQATTLDLSSFDTSNVADMRYMFGRGQATTLDLSNFNTSNVTNMNYMFEESPATTLDLSSFDTSNVTNMKYMFNNSAATTLDLSSFNTSNVTDMHYMFNGSQATTLDLSSFNTSNVTDMSNMFDNSAATALDLSNFDTSNVTYMTCMFSASAATTLDLSNFNTSNVTYMGGMFDSSQATTLDLSGFNTSKVIDMGSMFYNSQATTLDLSSFDTSNVTNMSGMFKSSQATTGYARTQADAVRFNTLYGKPVALTFIVK